MNAANAFQEGGASMWGVLCCGGFAHVMAIVALGFMLSKKRGAIIGTGAASLALGVVSMGVGLAGYLYGMSRVEEAIAFADPAMRDMLLAQGRSEAMNNLWFGACTCGIPALAGALVLVKGMLTKVEGPAERPIGRG